MSQRSKQMVLLGKQAAVRDSLSQSEDDENKENTSLNESFEPVSNWVLEVEPELLKNENSELEKQETYIENQTQQSKDNKINIISNVLLGSSSQSPRGNQISMSMPTDHINELQSEKIILIEVPYNPNVTMLETNNDIIYLSREQAARISDASSNNTDDNQFDAYIDDSTDLTNVPNDSSEGCESPIRDVLVSDAQIPSTSINFENIPTIIEEEVEKALKTHYKDRKDHCYFCEKDVSHFARHVTTWHASDIEVQRILSFPKGCKQRKQAFTDLKKKGNFIRNRSNTTLRPVKRLQLNATSQSDDFLPCKYCLGFYKKKSLYRHTKRCTASKEKNIRQTAQSDGQTTLLLNSLVKYDELLKSELFPRMRADEISLIAKKDQLICTYAYSYLKGRRSKGNLDFLRQNVRRLAKMLKFARNENPQNKHLIDVLKPSNFQLIIAAVNEIACYNPETEHYESPTLAMNFGTLLKKCCDLAFIQLLQQKDTGQQRDDLNMLKTLIESQWANEVSAQASTSLNQKKWNRVDLLPVTSDLKELNHYLNLKSEEAYTELTLNKNDKAAYNTLRKLLYSQIILLNRRRPAEVAQLKTETYKSINLDFHEETEFQNCLTETERILLNRYSRIVIRGKRGRGVPVLLSPAMRKYFDIIIKTRDNFVSDNDYVFHTEGKGFIDGTKTLQKIAEKSGIQRYNTITATRLRKHLATITQLLQFSNEDLEQLSTFMGHTLKTHCNVYRMTDNMYQTAKVSKLLLLMTQGGAEQFKGQKLDDINIDLEPILEDDVFEELLLENDENDEANECTFGTSDQQMQPISQVINKPDNKNVMDNIDLMNENWKDAKGTTEQLTQGTKKVENQRVNWTNKQKKIIAQYFSEHIKKKQSPKIVEVKVFMQLYNDLFGDKKWTSIKAIVYNMYTGKLKMD